MRETKFFFLSLLGMPTIFAVANVRFALRPTCVDLLQAIVTWKRNVRVIQRLVLLTSMWTMVPNVAKVFNVHRDSVHRVMHSAKRKALRCGLQELAVPILDLVTLSAIIQVVLAVLSFQASLSTVHHVVLAVLVKMEDVIWTTLVYILM